MRAVVRESLIGAVLAAGMAVLVSPGDLALGVPWPHPTWVAALLLAARYGSRGLFVAAPMGWALVGAAALLSHQPMHRLIDRLTSGPDVVTLVAAVLVAWIASAQEQRRRVLADELSEARARADAEHNAAKKLRTAVIGLRGRADRIETSLTFLRQVAARLDGSDPVQAARAAVELVIARLGPRAAVVQVGEGARLITVAWSGAWSAESPMPGDLTSDRTVAAAMARGRAVRALDLPDATVSDSDMAAPIQDANGTTVGVLAVRGLPQAGASVAMVQDLSTIAAWCAAPLAAGVTGAAERPRLAVLPSEPSEGEPPLPLAAAVSGTLETPDRGHEPDGGGGGGMSAAAWDATRTRRPRTGETVTAEMRL